MGIEHQPVPHDWNYFFCLEEDIIALNRPGFEEAQLFERIEP